MNKKETTIFYQNQIDICKKHFNAEQFGRLMYALFEVEDGNEPEVDDDIRIAFEFMALQKRLDREKYDKLCERNKENGKKGGRPKKEKNPEKPNGLFENPVGYLKNPNEDDDEDDNDNDNDDGDDNDTGSHHHHDSYFGSFHNVNLSQEEYNKLRAKYQNANQLIDKVSIWLKGAKNEVPNHFALCVKFATNDKWPKKPKEVPAEVIDIKDALSPEEQQKQVENMKTKLNGMFRAT